MYREGMETEDSANNSPLNSVNNKLFTCVNILWYWRYLLLELHKTESTVKFKLSLAKRSLRKWGIYFMTEKTIQGRRRMRRGPARPCAAGSSSAHFKVHACRILKRREPFINSTAVSLSLARMPKCGLPTQLLSLLSPWSYRSAGLPIVKVIEVPLQRPVY